MLCVDVMHPGTAAHVAAQHVSFSHLISWTQAGRYMGWDGNTRAGEGREGREG